MTTLDTLTGKISMLPAHRVSGSLTTMVESVPLDRSLD